MAGGEWRYEHPAGVDLVDVTGRPAWTTPQGGRVATDAALADLWRVAAGRDLPALIASSPVDEPTTRAAFACLAEAGLLARTPASMTAPPAPISKSAPGTSPLVSIVLVTYQSESWLDDCVTSIRHQAYQPIEIVMVDNASPRDPSAAVAERYPEVRFHRLTTPHSFAAAINRGVALAAGDYLVPLNPDVVLDPEAIGSLVARAHADSRCAAVAAKLCFMWAPAFLNGIGNRMEDRSWGTDNFIGHLDLGQFDAVREVPSACFAAALIPRSAWSAIGGLDEGFPMYYEDVEWCYRARLLGYTVCAAPDARVYHAFGSRVATGDTPELGARKLANVVYGRLRFAVKLLSASLRRRFLRQYTAEDRSNALASWRAGDKRAVRAYLQAWARLIADLPGLLATNRRLGRKARASLGEVFAGQASLPPGLVWQGLPELTIDHVHRVYLPLMTGGLTRPIPEFADVLSTSRQG